MTLMVALESYIVVLHATWGIEGDHQKQVLAIRHLLRSRYDRETVPTKMCLDVYWAIFLDGRVFVAQDKGVATSALDGLVASLHLDTMPTFINVPYKDLTGVAQPAAKKRKSLDSGLNHEGGGPGDRKKEPKTAYGAVDHPEAALVAK